jgi:hypothetical protein
MERRRNQIATVGLRLIGNIFILIVACQAPDRSPGQVAREFASSYRDGIRDSSFYRLVVGNAKKKLAHDRTDLQPIQMVIMDSALENGQSVFTFRLTEPGSTALPQEPSFLEVRIDSGKVIDYRFR